MADLFRCDHCGQILAKDKKRGLLRLEEIPWSDGVKFPSKLVHQHDLCAPCFGKLVTMVDSAMKALPKGG